ncbi:hypothetical protein WICMUC_001745 [Wickerhamomyces mucosus]|uniref:Histone-lysine N-methyltransferase, H3 lysine-36 specific n=1 Tax=Wickerhamomyces mucosus TaxID=1378264 RepID=A0A9P8PSR3_9ASCO|nr:hypothetical protein WICMUC_001745 [Wickerhamomyces mucosus]
MSAYLHDQDDDYEPQLESVESDLQDNFEAKDDSPPVFTLSQKEESQKKLDEKLEIKNKIPIGTNTFLHLEDKTEEALKTFENLEATTYQFKSLGDSGQNTEFMECECYEEWEDGHNIACQDDYCINRGTKIECFGDSTKCGESCSNRRFQKKEYAPINVFQTEKKGFGVRAQADLEPDTFIYEYIGEVIDEKTFKKKMIEYDERNFKHFYFMMLQKGEFIDATLKGSLGRFCNHSCNPNCYVEKWVVGEKLKMGIFSKRRIIKGEELTFNYNVDRYGADSQACYCGERNCIGFIGGKTQTDAASLLPQFISEALGSSIEEEQAYILVKKQNKEKIEKNENNVNVEYVNSLAMKPIDIFEINKVTGVLFQCEDKLIAEKLIERIELTDAENIIKKLYYSHGIESFKRILKNHLKQDKQIDTDDELVRRIFRILLDGPSLTKNYIQKSGIEPVIDNIITVIDDGDIAQLGADILDRFSQFEERVVIKKSADPRNNKTFTSFHSRAQSERTEKQENLSPPQTVKQEPPLPLFWKVAYSDGTPYYYHIKTNETTWERPVESKADIEQRERERREFEKNKLRREREKAEQERRVAAEKLELERKNKASELQKIIDKARAAETAQLLKEEEEARRLEEKLKRKQEYKEKLALKKKKETDSTSDNLSKEDFERKWGKFFAGHIPNMVKKYREEIGIEKVKKCAKEISKVLIEKEYRKDSQKSPPKDLDNSKYKKIKAFAHEFMGKYLDNHRNKQKRKLEKDENSLFNNAAANEHVDKKPHLNSRAEP